MERKKPSSSPRQQNQQPSKEQNKGKPSGLNSFVRYSGMGFQMVAIVLIFYWAGSKLDERSGNEKPLYTAILTLLGVFAAIYLVLKDFIIKKND